MKKKHAAIAGVLAVAAVLVYASAGTSVSDELLATATADSFFTQLIDSHADLTFASAKYELSNPFNTDLTELELDTSTQDSNNLVLTSLLLSEAQNVTTEVTRVNYVTECSKELIEVKTNDSSIWTPNCTTTPVYSIEKVVSETETPIKTLSLKAGEKKIIVVRATYPAALGLRSIDWVPKLVVKKRGGLFGSVSKDTEFKQGKWALWTSGWLNRNDYNVTIDNSVERVNDAVIINATGLIGVTNCSYLRATSNYSTETQIDFKVLDDSGINLADGSKWCLLGMPGNLSNTQNATYSKWNNTAIFVYHNNYTNVGPYAFNEFRFFDSLAGTSKDWTGWREPSSEAAPQNWNNWSTHAGSINFVKGGAQSYAQLNVSGKAGSMGWVNSSAGLSSTGWTAYIRMKSTTNVSAAFEPGICVQGTIIQAEIFANNSGYGISECSAGTRRNWIPDASIAGTWHYYRMTTVETAVGNYTTLWRDGVNKFTITNDSTTTNNQIVAGIISYGGTSTAQADVQEFAVKTNGLYTEPIISLVGSESAPYFMAWSNLTTNIVDAGAGSLILGTTANLSALWTMQETFAQQACFYYNVSSSNLANNYWWNLSWAYKKPINLSVAQNTTLANYPVLLNVSYATGMNVDFSDLRFVNGSDNTLLNYWIGTKVNSSYANAWVQVDQNLTNSTNYTIYMYYGNPTAVDVGTDASIFLYSGTLNSSVYAYWFFDNKYTPDDSPAARTATLINSSALICSVGVGTCPSYNASGKRGQSLNINGDASDGLNYTMTAVNSTWPWAYSFWLNAKNATTTAQDVVNGGNHVPRAYIATSGGGTFTVAYKTIANAYTQAYNLAYANYYNTWTHIAIVWNGTDLITYFNGIVAGDVVTTMYGSPTNNRYIGSAYASTSFNGTFDDYYYFNKTIQFAVPVYSVGTILYNPCSLNNQSMTNPSSYVNYSNFTYTPTQVGNFTWKIFGVDNTTSVRNVTPEQTVSVMNASYAFALSSGTAASFKCSSHGYVTNFTEPTNQTPSKGLFNFTNYGSEGMNLSLYLNVTPRADVGMAVNSTWNTSLTYLTGAANKTVYFNLTNGSSAFLWAFLNCTNSTGYKVSIQFVDSVKEAG
jgi:hypothetical protein